jgi:periplasmic protein CpxP/Spy
MELLRTPKRLFLAAAVLAAVAFPAAGPLQAQATQSPASPGQTDAPPPPPDGGPHRGGMRPEHRVEMLQHALNLTPDQTSQVRAVMESERPKMEALRGNSSLSQEDRRTQMMVIHQDESSRIRALLTPDQATKYDNMEARMREHRGPGGNPPSPVIPGETPGPGPS